MEIIHAIILGIIEGLTEFLPISSTGHLIVAEAATGFKDKAELFTVVIQMGAIAAVLWYYRKDIFSKILGLIKRDKNALQFWKNLFVASIPAGILGLIFYSVLDNIARPSVVGLMLILGGIVLILVENHHKEKDRPRRPGQYNAAQLDLITTRQALGIGLAQCLSLVPGVSRSGASIVGGLLSGLDRVTATAFSFYLSIPVILAAGSYKLIKDGSAISQLPGGSAALIAGTISSFITALLAISWLLRYVSNHDFKGFAYYRITFGIIILLLVGLRFIR